MHISCLLVRQCGGSCKLNNATYFVKNIYSYSLASLYHVQHALPSLKSDEAEQMVDFCVRQKNRLLYPGACSLEYQSLVQIVLECLLGWDSNNRKGREGILGVLEAFCRGDEEQGRGSNHGHWLIWVARFNRLRSMLRSRDRAVREEGREKFLAYVSKVISARYGDFDLVVTHNCANNQTIKAPASTLFEDVDPQLFCDARHKVKCHEINGSVMRCKTCGDLTSPSKVVTSALQTTKDEANEDVDLPLPKN